MWITFCAHRIRTPVLNRTCIQLVIWIDPSLYYGFSTIVPAVPNTASTVSNWYYFTIRGFWTDLELLAHSAHWPWQQQLLSTTYCKLQRNYILFWHKIFAPRKKLQQQCTMGWSKLWMIFFSFFTILHFHKKFRQLCRNSSKNLVKIQIFIKIKIILQKNFHPIVQCASQHVLQFWEQQCTLFDFIDFLSCSRILVFPQ